MAAPVDALAALELGGADESDAATPARAPDAPDEPRALADDDVAAARACADATAEDTPVLVIVLVGLCGAGKSSTANRLAGRVEARETPRARTFKMHLVCRVAASCAARPHRVPRGCS